MPTIVPAASGSRRLRTLAAAAALAAAVAVAPASAHFVLETPAASLAQNTIGDPQKLGPCGGTSQDAGTATGAVTELAGGSTLHLKLREAVFHPGHYRVALAVNSRAELPPDPPPHPANTIDSATIDFVLLMTSPRSGRSEDEHERPRAAGRYAQEPWDASCSVDATR